MVILWLDEVVRWYVLHIELVFGFRVYMRPFDRYGHSCWESGWIVHIWVGKQPSWFRISEVFLQYIVDYVTWYFPVLSCFNGTSCLLCCSSCEIYIDVLELGLPCLTLKSMRNWSRPALSWPPCLIIDVLPLIFFVFEGNKGRVPLWLSYV